MLSELSLRFIAELEPYRVDHKCRFVHGFPPDSSLIYFFQVSDTHKKEVLDEMPERLCFVGHTHALEIVEYNGEDLEYSDLSEGLVPLEADKQYIINIGSVGQPRDGNNKSKYAIWDSAKNIVEVKFIAYDIATVVQKIKAAGLPENHAQRLW
jgi:diadenosine tetraphosphatase ApaH/serine/threonine PP2A family protein phosphatase